MKNVLAVSDIKTGFTFVPCFDLEVREDPQYRHHWTLVSLHQTPQIHSPPHHLLVHLQE